MIRPESSDDDEMVLYTEEWVTPQGSDRHLNNESTLTGDTKHVVRHLFEVEGKDRTDQKIGRFSSPNKFYKIRIGPSFSDVECGTYD